MLNYVRVPRQRTAPDRENIASALAGRPMMPIRPTLLLLQLANHPLMLISSLLLIHLFIRFICTSILHCNFCNCSEAITFDPFQNWKIKLSQPFLADKIFVFLPPLTFMSLLLILPPLLTFSFLDFIILQNMDLLLKETGIVEKIKIYHIMGLNLSGGSMIHSFK